MGKGNAIETDQHVSNAPLGHAHVHKNMHSMSHIGEKKYTKRIQQLIEAMILDVTWRVGCLAVLKINDMTKVHNYACTVRTNPSYNAIIH